jgi:uracil-DNA glycosylase family 4
VKRASFREETYFARPVPNFGDPLARLLVVGLAPAAHGANRTGRLFTGDRSGDLLFRVMHRAGFVNRPAAVRAGDGLRLTDALLTAACHCAPPDNAPAPQELRNCAPFLEETLDAASRVRVVVALGKTAFDSVLRIYRRRGWVERASRFSFAHGAEVEVPGAPLLLASYHPSQQNTFTGRLTEPMLLGVFERAREWLRG